MSEIAEYEEDYDTFIPEMDQPRPDAFCDTYEAHDPHIYRALNTNYYRCPGIGTADLAELMAMTEATCEHGMAAWLCSGPMHY
jgi:hypothetical protein